MKREGGGKEGEGDYMKNVSSCVMYTWSLPKKTVNCM